ncbi:hypothetical protein CathTA2_2217 [Caldalkalibacillus thermarum TA2.A1]|uniref:Anti-sigma-W factor RsiW n=1 Tax=Caldalkalibacillus thermarum (strain TA2.A1) TaxID=986075 RepID=F5L8R2_CALTT|nr:zf-HC2 domain-containing protein [Caldalkalibacillus thermarum]EGL82301.1 hypothetical protein CathTA2_2217 [Caldalkalibacillus thermarum TA2.A1]QZT33408.1 zf-HC2 domain-containing protein [Caldalkalibacillus thermarum TA2.A1]
MSCEEVLHLIQRHLDHDLTEDEHRQLDQHLSHCPSCAATFQKYQALHQRLEQLPQVNPPLSIVDRIDFAKLDANNETIGKQIHTSTFLSSRKIVWAIGGVAALILVAFSLLFGQDHEQALDEGVHTESAVLEGIEEVAGSDEGLGSERHDAEDRHAMEVREEADAARDQPLLLVEERERIYSPDQSYSAYIGPDHEDIRIDKRIDGQDQPYYISANPVSSAWIIEEIEWVSDHELYYVLYHEERDERQYWLFNADKREEIQLEGPYPEYQPEGS